MAVQQWCHAPPHVMNTAPGYFYQPSFYFPNGQIAPRPEVNAVSQNPNNTVYQNPANVVYQNPANMAHREPDVAYQNFANFVYQNPANNFYQNSTNNIYQNPVNNVYQNPANNVLQNPASYVYQNRANNFYQNPVNNVYQQPLDFSGYQHLPNEIVRQHHPNDIAWPNANNRDYHHRSELIAHQHSEERVYQDQIASDGRSDQQPPELRGHSLSNRSRNHRHHPDFRAARSGNRWHPKDSVELMDFTIVQDAAVVSRVPQVSYEPPQEVIGPLTDSSPSIATQVSRDENPDNYILNEEEQERFRRLFPLNNDTLLPLRFEDDTRPTLVLDLDETLIHTTFQTPSEPTADNMEKLYVSMRPFLKSFLKTVCQWYEVVIYTASLPAYADKILDGLDPENDIFSYRLYRQHCSFFKGIYVKDLEMLGRPLDRVVFVDNYPGAYMMQPSNALPICSFLGNVEDSELFQVTKFLSYLRTKDDVRPMLKRYQLSWKRKNFTSGPEHDARNRN